MLTRKQYELLIFIDRHLRENGVSPSFDEMKEALGLKSKSGIHRLITGLEERGFIRRLAHRARALEIRRMPENIAHPQGGREAGPKPKPKVRDAGFAPNVVKGEFRMSGVAASDSSSQRVVEIPLWGRIAAGTPIEALRDHSRSLEVPAGLLASGGEHYALEVDGDSMVEAGIHDGDTVIVRHVETAENGTIVVALVNDEEVTLKRIRRRGQSIALEPANKDYETRIFGPDQVKVQGRLVGLIRKY